MSVDTLVGLLPYAATLVAVLLAIATSSHAVLYKRDPRAAFSWMGVIWLAPVVGPALYVLFGINRIQRRAVRLRRRRKRFDAAASPEVCTPEELHQALGPDHLHLLPLQRLGDHVIGRPLLEGNRVTPLVDGEQAYPDMLSAIEAAERSVCLLAYIFEKDSVGERFIQAIGRAVARGAKARVLVDHVGGGGTLGATRRAFKAAGVPMEIFLPIRLPFRTRHMNLRNHRKILVVDGRVGYTGGMNIRESHLVQAGSGHREHDVQFKLEGPVVEHLQQAFVDDWAFATGEVLRGEDWFPKLRAEGAVIARGIPFDPGEVNDSLRWTIAGSLSCARRSARIVTPYFLPDQALIAALNVAALRGVEVDILIPKVNDNPFVDWAMTATLWQVLGGGCRVWRTRPPFDHTKVMVVDGAWVLLGSANFDPRSLRLNFEFNVECFDRTLAGGLESSILAKRDGAEEVTLRKVNGRRLVVKMRDGIARLFSPYL